MTSPRLQRFTDTSTFPFFDSLLRALQSNAYPFLRRIRIPLAEYPGFVRVNVRHTDAVETREVIASLCAKKRIDLSWKSGTELGGGSVSRGEVRIRVWSEGQ
jgi:hypothetical protein